jgi:hypothetical protein
VRVETAQDLRNLIVDYVSYLEKIGVVQKLKGGGLRVIADRFEFGIATNKEGKKGLCLILTSDTTKLQMIFVVDDKALLSQMERGINEILREGRKDVA